MGADRVSTVWERKPDGPFDPHPGEFGFNDRPGEALPHPTPTSNVDQSNAYEVIMAELRRYGLESLGPDVLRWVQEGYTSERIMIELPKTAAYQKRFSANAERLKAGLPVLSPAEYLAVENSYREIMSTAGLPIGFYDEPSDFTSWIAQNVSPYEIQTRVRVASEMVSSLDQNALDAFGAFYSQGDMVAYALDRDRATAVLDRQWRAAQIAGASRLVGFESDQQLSERLADMGVDRNSAQEGFAQAANLSRDVGRLSSLYGGTYDETSAVGETFLSDTGAGKERRRLASQERASFSGSSAASGQSLSARDAGQV